MMYRGWLCVHEMGRN